jgi:hypothetical protein
MTLQLNEAPNDAWVKYIAPSLNNPKWIESSEDLSSDIGLSRRELLGLIIYSYRLNPTGTTNVCWDDADQEPNDGYLDFCGQQIRCEHKLVPQFTREEVTNAIIETYRKYAKRGVQYGGNRHLLVHANRESVGLARISRLHDDINGIQTFDKVFLIGLNGVENNTVLRFSISEHFPQLDIKHIRIDASTGRSV